MRYVKTMVRKASLVAFTAAMLPLVALGMIAAALARGFVAGWDLGSQIMDWIVDD